MAEPVPMRANDLVDLLDRVVDRGVVVNGDVIISLADIDLIRLDLRLLLTAVQRSMQAGPQRPVPGEGSG